MAKKDELVKEALEGRDPNTGIYDPEGIDAIDVRILNWIGRFIKPMESRIDELERQVRFLESLVISPVEIKVKSTKQEEDEVSGS